MLFIQIVILLLVISFVLALWSLRGINNKPNVEHLRKKLNKGRIIFQSHKSSSGSS